RVFLGRGPPAAVAGGGEGPGAVPGVPGRVRLRRTGLRGVPAPLRRPAAGAAIAAAGVPAGPGAVGRFIHKVFSTRSRSRLSPFSVREPRWSGASVGVALAVCYPPP